MNVRTEYTPNVIRITNDDTGEVLVFSLCGELKYVRLFELRRERKPSAPTFSDYG